MIAYQANEAVLLRLKHPIGKLLIGPPEKTISMLREEIGRRRPIKLFAVGDVVTLNILRSGIQVDFVIVDFKSKRQPFEAISLENFKVVNVKNPAGVITTSAYEAVREICQASRPTAIVVEGEEDLLTLPVIKFAPLGSLIVYGQPYAGIVLVTVTEGVKLEAELLMKKMESSL